MYIHVYSLFVCTQITRYRATSFRYTTTLKMTPLNSARYDLMGNIKQ